MIQSFLKPMLPTLSEELPTGEKWVYEVKYDGFRCLLYWDHSLITMTSRNGHPFHTIFPEIPDYLKSVQHKVKHLLPLLVDGELCILADSYKANFEYIQKRGRLKQTERIIQSAKLFPSSFCAFDLLAFNGQYTFQEPFMNRKKSLKSVFEMLGIDVSHVEKSSFINFVPYSADEKSIDDLVKKKDSEGIVAKTIHSKWSAGTRTTQWIKVKNLKIGVFILLGYDTENSFFHVGLVKGTTIQPVGLFAHGISTEEKEALIHIVKRNQSEKKGSFIRIEPSLCVELSFLEWYKEQLRQPRFIRFRFDADWEDCTWEKLQRNN
ncbi:hypothetical protein KUV80_06870 [Fictibacillus nanhaiensis]|uniref:ATP-dependent DNA ligase n=1 Tax=Fictibacillus nanhaiensis TaxID=742169 RepID=UPI001C95F622|nr:RNA ligase family protein [Fictibacillus nanhaiensis]MBY6036367.1 hypothetical protein [Fictibacillus nanhaiensis]